MKILFKKYTNSTFVILFLILLLGLFLRTYKLEIFYSFGHDQDLSAWIAKDIIVDHHLRLIGQETSVLGIFVGPLFYYLMAASFALFHMNPLSGALVTTIISLLTIVSIYYIFNKFYNRNVGLIGAFLYAIAPGAVFGDRWVVPTQPTILWSVWFLYILFCILKGNFQILVPLGILIGLIWHIHIALLPLLILLPIAVLISQKKDIKIKYSFKTILISFSFLLILLSPFLIFETKYNGEQIRSFITATQTNKDSYTGIDRLAKVINSSGRVFAGVFVLSGNVYDLSQSFIILLLVILLLIIINLRNLKILQSNQVMILIFWYLIVSFSQFLSRKPISEYYFGNLIIILFLVLSLLFSYLNDKLKKIPLITFLLIIYAITTIIWLTNMSDGASGFLNKREAIEFIKSDSSNKGYPCIGINHIEPAQNVISGFRYLFWYYNLNVIKPNNDIPVYSIVNPWTISGREVNVRFGDIGVILPSIKKVDPKICSESSRQLLQLWGFNN